MRPAYRPALASILLVMLFGAAHGFWTDRWSPSEDLQLSLKRIERFPMNAGDWKGENVAYEPEDMARNGIQGCVFRRFRNIRTGATVSVLLVCGRGGPISVHTPDVCYTAAGFQQSGGQSKTQFNGPESEFWKSYFILSNSIVPQRLEIFWAWSRDGQSWSAPDSPRYAFARFPSVYKLYVVRESPVSLRNADETGKDFLGILLPELRTAFTE